MNSIQAQIQQAASQNATLLEGLRETDAAPSQLQQQSEYIRDLDHQLGDIENRVGGLKKSTAKELKDHEKYRDSTLRRFAHKASGRREKFAEKAAKEEKEYFDAIQAQKTAEDELAYVKQLKAEATIQHQSFSQAADRHKRLQAELDTLYNSIFAGHTPDFPAEDQAEEACNAALNHVQTTNQRLEREKHILFLLGQISHKLSEARNHLDGAYQMSSLDMWGGGAWVSMQKRNYLERAESCIQQVRMLQEQVSQLAPEIANLGPLQIAMGSIWSDVVFDNIFTDMDMHDKVKSSIALVDNAGNECGTIIRNREIGLRNIQGEVGHANEQLKSTRVALQQAREDAFRRVLGGEQIGSGLGSPPPGDVPSDAPPAYAPPFYKP